MNTNSDRHSFRGHLDELRDAVLKMAAAAVVFSLIAFLFREQLFAVILAPKESGFITYSLLFRAAGLPDGAEGGNFSVQLINTGLAGQFMIHLKAALCAGLLCAAPYILYKLFRFVSPALYADERKYAVRVAGAGYVMFMAGVLLTYFLLFPLTFRFLGTYQVAEEVGNMISLQSYMGTLITMCVAMGLIFEMPVVCWLFGKLGFLTDAFMRKYRRHAIVVVLTVAAVITPTSDLFTLMLVSLPIWLLYEISIFLVRPRKEKSVMTKRFTKFA